MSRLNFWRFRTNVISSSGDSVVGLRQLVLASNAGTLSLFVGFLSIIVSVIYASFTHATGGPLVGFNQGFNWDDVFFYTDKRSTALANLIFVLFTLANFLSVATLCLWVTYRSGYTKAFTIGLSVVGFLISMVLGFVGYLLTIFDLSVCVIGLPLSAILYVTCMTFIMRVIRKSVFKRIASTK